jgi:hypothetical protein
MTFFYKINKLFKNYKIILYLIFISKSFKLNFEMFFFDLNSSKIKYTFKRALHIIYDFLHNVS